MNKNVTFFISLSIFFLFPFLAFNNGNCAASDQTIQWLPFEEGMALSAQEGKKVFLHFYADWCKYCKIMQQETFADPGVIKVLQENFVSIKINSDQDKKRATEYRVTGLPVTWFLTQDGEKIGNRPGFIPPKDFVAFLKYISTNSYKSMSLKTFLEQSNDGLSP